MAKKSAAVYRIKCCAFCGLTQFQVGVLIQGPAINFESNVHICGECVDICAGIVLEHNKVSGGNQPSEAERAVTPSASEAP